MKDTSRKFKALLSQIRRESYLDLLSFKTNYNVKMIWEETSLSVGQL